MVQSYKEKLANITTFLFKGPGVLLSPRIDISRRGETNVGIHLKDLFALQECSRQGVRVVILNDLPEFFPSDCIKSHLPGVEVEETGMPGHGSADGLWRRLKADPSGILFMGYDIPDLEVAKAAAIATCPADATMELKALSHHVSTSVGGAGCIRDIVEQSLRIKGLWKIS